MTRNNTFGEHNLETAKHAINGLPQRAFCVVCGELRIKDGKIEHPESDRICAELLNNGFTTTYTSNH
jgi:hypothetical protein